MKNILYSESAALQLPREVQLRRVRAAIEGGLSELQRQTLLDYYLHQKTITQIAKKRGVHKSTVLRTLRRAENKLRTYLRY